MRKIYKSELSAAIHEAASDLCDLDIMDKKTMREFDESCLVKPPAFSPDEIRSLRERERVSQPVFAKYLNVTKNLVSDWERGVKKPGGPATLLLALIKQGGLNAIRLWRSCLGR